MKRAFSPDTPTPRSSKTEFLISGLRVYIYGLHEAKKHGSDEVAVLYHLHGRGGSYRDSEAFAHEVLYKFRSHPSKKKMGMIAIAFDARNHGERTVHDKMNMSWDEGNESHAQDMLSVISGTAQDVMLLMHYLPTYLPEFKSFCNIVSGKSLGGHTAWRLATAPGANIKFHGLAIIIGCPNLSALLLSRLGVDLDALNVPINQVHAVPYDKLSAVLTETQRQRWPRALSELVSEFDEETQSDFPKNLGTYILNGKEDPLVPDKFTAAWVKDRRNRGYENLEYFVQENTGHELTPKMIDLIAQWLIRTFVVRR